MIKYALPDFTKNLPINLAIAEMKRTVPEMFFNDIAIDSMYGCFPDCIMNGGRVIDGKRYSYDQIVKTFDQIEKEGIGICLTFTNMLIKTEHFHDDYSNMILKAAQGHNVKVIVYSDDLGEYIASNYHLKLILSTTRKLKSVDELNMMLDRYDMVVLDYNHNKDDAFLKQISDPSRIEVMPNEPCRPNCPSRQKHYEEDSKCQLRHMPPTFVCPYNCSSLGITSQTENSPHLLSNEAIRRLNTSYGITYFKIVGRRITVYANIESYLYYLIRPEYRGVITKILKSKFQL